MLPELFLHVKILHVVFYVNDMSSVIGNKLLYANDSAILVADKDISTVENALQTDLKIVSEWLIDNKL